MSTLLLETNMLVRGTRETEMRPVWGWPKPHTPNTEQRHKTYSVEQLRTIREIRHNATKDRDASGHMLLLPPLPCSYKICSTCETYRAYWDKALLDYQPHTISLF